MTKLSPSDRKNRCNPTEKQNDEVYDALGSYSESFRPLIELLGENERCEIALLDLPNDRFLYCRRKAGCVLNYFFNNTFPESFGIDFFLSQLEPGDVRFVTETKTRTHEYLMALPANQRQQYRLTIDFCRKIAERKFSRAMLHALTLTANDDGSVWIVMFLLLPISENNRYTPSMRSFCNRHDRKQLLFPKSDEHTIYFTDRQRETIQLSSGGLIAKEIAQRLSIKFYTTNHHLCNCRKRMHISTNGQMVYYYNCVVQI